METQTTIIICLVILIFQLLLCFKAKRKLLKLLPMILLAIPTSVFLVLMHTTSGYDAPVYAMFTLLFAIFLVPCVAGWVVWMLYNMNKVKR